MLLLTVLSDRWYVGGLEGLDGGGTFPSRRYDLHLQPVVGGGPQVGDHKHVVILHSRGVEEREGGGGALVKQAVDKQAFETDSVLVYIQALSACVHHNRQRLFS